MKKLLLVSLTLQLALVGCTVDNPVDNPVKDLSTQEAFDEYKSSYTSYQLAETNFFEPEASFRQSSLYRMCQAMPKGADLHVHCDAMLPIVEQIKFVSDHPNELVVCCVAGKDFGMLRYIGDGTPCPEGYKTMADALNSGCTQDDFVRAWTIKGTGTQRAWDWFEGIFDKNINLTSSVSLLEDYYTRAFNFYLDQGVVHMELRPLFFGDHAAALERGRAIYRAMNTARKKNPEFSVRLIGCGLKAKTDAYDKTQYNEMLIDNAVYVSLNLKDTVAGLKDFLVGLDLVNEEDLSVRLTDFKELLANARKQNPNLHLTLHSGESLKSDNVEISSALSLGAERIGHGFNLYKYPDVLAQVKQNGIALEVCPISNHYLGYADDLTQHPAKDYIRQGVSVVLCDDDPAYLEGNPYVDDVFAAVVAWNLSLDELEQLFRLSITKSFLTEDLKQQHLASFEKRWAAFRAQKWQ